MTPVALRLALWSSTERGIMTYRYFGIDIHKDFVVYAAVDEKQKTIL
jgi:hypothetical protein